MISFGLLESFKQRGIICLLDPNSKKITKTFKNIKKVLKTRYIQFEKKGL